MDFFDVLSTTTRIKTSNRRHFGHLSLLILLPLSISLLISPTLSLTTSLPISLFTFILSLLATGTYTHSTSEAFLGRQLSVSGSLKSLSLSFFPLLATVLVVQAIIALLLATFALVFIILTFALEGTDYAHFAYFWGGSGLLALAFSIIICLQVNWLLAFVVVIVEGKWGFEPLRRSKYLVKEMNSTAFRIVVLFDVMSLCIWVTFNPMYNSFGDISECLSSIVMIIGGWCAVIAFLEYYFVSTTVLYMYCKAKHEELPSEIAEEFDGEYVSVPINNDDVAGEN